MNKKLFGIIGVILVVVLLIIGASIKPKGNKNSSNNDLSNDMNTVLSNAEQESVNASNDQSTQKELPEISVTQYMEYYTGSEDKLVLVARPTCHYCQIAEPIIRKIAYDYNLEINYLNTDNFSDEDAQTFMSSNENFSEGFGTPILLSVSNSQIKDKVDGLTDTAHYIDFFKRNNYIK